MGGVGSGKSLTIINYYLKHKKKDYKKIIIITTAKKRNDKEWEKELLSCGITNNFIIDSWQNIKKYKEEKNKYFIFDEQKLIGSGVWVKTFYEIAKNNSWNILSATPGDVWKDYIPVFVANGFYKNATEFYREHAVYNRFSKFPQIERYIGTKKLNRYKEDVLIQMEYNKKNIRNEINVLCDYDEEIFKIIYKKRWNPFKNEPIQNISEFTHVCRRSVNIDASRINKIKELMINHDRIIIFYNFNYELDILRSLSNITTVAEYNGYKHEEIPKTKKWVYLVQYTSGAEGWNCIDTNIMVFYSLNYAYKIMEQSMGRIDRLNAPIKNLFYFKLYSNSEIDKRIMFCINNKKIFNESNFFNKSSSR